MDDWIEGEIVIIAFDIFGGKTQEDLYEALIKFRNDNPELVESWWHAEDHRTDNSDNHSAFFEPGYAESEARAEVVRKNMEARAEYTRKLHERA